MHFLRLGITPILLNYCSSCHVVFHSRLHSHCNPTFKINFILQLHAGTPGRFGGFKTELWCFSIFCNTPELPDCAAEVPRALWRMRWHHQSTEPLSPHRAHELRGKKIKAVLWTLLCRSLLCLLFCWLNDLSRLVDLSQEPEHWREMGTREKRKGANREFEISSWINRCFIIGFHGGQECQKEKSSKFEVQ